MYDAITDEPLLQSCQTRVRWKALDELETMRSLLGSVEVVLASKAAGQWRDLFPFVRIRNIHLGNSEQRTGDKRNGCRCRNGQAKSAGTTLSTTGIDSGRSARRIGKRQGNAVAKMAWQIPPLTPPGRQRTQADGGDRVAAVRHWRLSASGGDGDSMDALIVFLRMPCSNMATSPSSCRPCIVLQLN